MESVQILAQISTEEGVPQDWLVFPLLRQKVITGILGWIFGVVVGGLLLVFMVPIMIPHNYQMGTLAAVVTTLILVMVAYICLGSLWAMVGDLQRLLNVEKHKIIITPRDFVKQEGEKVIHVPLENVKYVTARGVPPPVDRSMARAREDTRSSSVGEGVSSLLFGRRVAESGRRGLGRKRMRTPTTLAFIDDRTDDEVIVVTDKAYGDPHFIAAHLKQYSASVQRIV